MAAKAFAHTPMNHVRGHLLLVLAARICSFPPQLEIEIEIGPVVLQM